MSAVHSKAEPLPSQLTVMFIPTQKRSTTGPELTPASTEEERPAAVLCTVRCSVRDHEFGK